MKKIDRICSWCSNLMGKIEVSDDMSDSPTHGICESCYKNQMAEIKEIRNSENRSFGKENKLM